ncbi:MAG: family 10 glycosylhydrolase [Clostridia bacterium]|nr:family 10 glycosylhydrolase [Clostridia bacterium]
MKRQLLNHTSANHNRLPLTKALRQLVLSAVLPLLMFFFWAQPALAAEQPVRGVWIATVYSIDFPHTDTVASQQQELRDILDTAEKAGLNAVFFQVRPTGDSYYLSGVFPWAKSLTGTAGKDPGWDPLAYLIEQADARGIAVHAWVNPYRLTEGSVSNPTRDVSALPAGHPARENPAMAVAYDDGKLYLDPGNPDSIDLVVRGVEELVRNYNLAGIHFDDYFYPSPTVTKDGKTYTAAFDDAESYARYGGSLSLADWRRSNTRRLIEEVGRAIRAIDPDCAFGVAPSGIWRNASSDPAGSDTTGFESYSSLYADVRSWVKDGLIDYVCPQIYWPIGQKGSDYDVLVRWWSDVCRDTGVALYIGHAAYRVGETTAWKDTSEIPRQLALNEKLGNVEGAVFYGYSKIKENTLGLADTLRALFVQGAALPASSSIAKAPIPEGTPKADGLVIASPGNGSTLTSAKSYIIGAGDPNEPIYVNGQEIDRTPSGYFCLYVPLTEGKNTFVFEHQGKTTNYTLIRKTASSSSGGGIVLNDAAFAEGTLFPTSNSRYAPGETFTLTCVAPQGSSVTAALGGTTYALSPEQVVSTKGSVPAQKYTATVTMRPHSGKGLISLGAPSYTLVYNGKTVKKSAPSQVYCYMKDDTLVGTINVDCAVMRTSNSSSASRKTSLFRGARDYIVWETDTYYQFRYGGWTLKSNVKTSHEKLPSNIAANVTGFSTAHITSIQWKLPTFPAYTMKEKNGSFELTLHNTTDVRSRITLASNPLLHSVTCHQKGNDAVYTFTFKEGAALNGFTLSHNGGYLTLALRNPPTLAAGDKPLAGKTILVDAGHGGGDPGASGPLGANGDREKELNLRAALALKKELENRGAAVMMTRAGDESVSLEERVAITRSVRPVLFVSLHHNSVDYVTDVGKCYGVTTYYSEDFSAPLAAVVQRYAAKATGAYSRGAVAQGLAVCRVYECPSILVELGFVTNPNEYELLVDDSYIQKETKGIADGVVAYLGGER